MGGGVAQAKSSSVPATWLLPKGPSGFVPLPTIQPKQSFSSDAEVVGKEYLSRWAREDVGGKGREEEEEEEEKGSQRKEQRLV